MKNIHKLATLERSKRLCKKYMNAVALQHKRINCNYNNITSNNAFDILLDLEFMVIALCRLRKSAIIIKNDSIDGAIKKFDESIPSLQDIRNVGEHIDEYSIDKGHNKNISRKQLECSYIEKKEDGIVWGYLGYMFNTNKSLEAAAKLFKHIITLKSTL